MQDRTSWFARPSRTRGPRRHWRAPMKCVAALVTLIVLLIIPVHAALAQTGEISGTVVSEVSQRPIAGVQVIVDGQAGKGTVTDASGHFHIADVSGAQVTLNARMLGFRPASQTVRVYSAIRLAGSRATAGGAAAARKEATRMTILLAPSTFN